jgi:urea transport system substrate-binding protein
MIIRWLWTLLLVSALIACEHKNNTPIKIGVLHSQTGAMAFNERNLVDAVMLAAEQINAAGGVLGRPLQLIVVDGASDWDRFAAEAERLIEKDKVAVIFACWTSSCRKAVKPVVEKHRHLFFYPLQYEGLEQSPNIVYTGAAPNQQIIPSVHWALENIGKRVYLVGSDYVFPHTANMIIKDLLKNYHLEVLGEFYLPLASMDIAPVMAEIDKLKPDLIINTINGDSNIAFFKALQSVSKTTVLSYSIAEPEVKLIGVELMAGHYAAWNYFQSIPSKENIEFVSVFKQRFGEERVISDPMVAAYTGVYLWAQAVEAAASFDPENVRTVLGHQSLKAPEGIVSIDAVNQHLWKTVRIGRVRKDGQFDIVWSSGAPVRPMPFPSYLSKNEWLQRVDALKQMMQR